jgi:hypothetical protein
MEGAEGTTKKIWVPKDYVPRAAVQRPEEYKDTPYVPQLPDLADGHKSLRSSEI